MIRQSNATQIIANLWLGNAIIAKSKYFMKENNIKYIVNVSCNIPNYFNDITYMNISVQDKDVAPKNTVSIYNHSGEFIFNSLKENKGILIHCKQGNNKSASIVAAFLMKHLELNLPTTLKYITVMRPNSLIRVTNFTNGLIMYSNSLL
jgi:hypothetical protein